MHETEKLERHRVVHAALNGGGLSRIYDKVAIAGGFREEDVDFAQLAAYIAMYCDGVNLPEFMFVKTSMQPDLTGSNLAVAALTCDPHPDIVREQQDRVLNATDYIHDGTVEDSDRKGKLALAAAHEAVSELGLPVAFLFYYRLLSGRAQMDFAFVKTVPLSLMWGIFRLGAPAGVLDL